MIIQRDEWLRALSEAGEPLINDQQAITVNEFAEMMQLSSRSTAERKLKRLVGAGHAIRTLTIRTNNYGRTNHLIGYRLVQSDASKP